MKNILMNEEMTKAILEGRKVQTRRVVKGLTKDHVLGMAGQENGVIDIINPETNEISFAFSIGYEDEEQYENSIIHIKPQFQIGETIWVREPARVLHYNDCQEVIYFKYLADGKESEIFLPERYNDTNDNWITRHQGIPNGCIKEMARIFLKITNVRVERLQDMPHDDIFKEGYLDNGDFHMCSAGREIKEHEWWEELWNKTAPKGYKWEDNPYVFVYEFERVKNEQ